MGITFRFGIGDGAGAGYYLKIPKRLVAAIMAFGSGVLISALSFDLMDEAYKTGGFDSTSIVFITGALIYTIANIIISKKRCQAPQTFRRTTTFRK
jgi:ZIP family zinc transporter